MCHFTTPGRNILRRVKIQEEVKGRKREREREKEEMRMEKEDEKAQDMIFNASNACMTNKIFFIVSVFFLLTNSNTEKKRPSLNKIM